MTFPYSNICYCNQFIFVVSKAWLTAMHVIVIGIVLCSTLQLVSHAKQPYMLCNTTICSKRCTCWTGKRAVWQLFLVSHERLCITKNKLWSFMWYRNILLGCSSMKSLHSCLLSDKNICPYCQFHFIWRDAAPPTTPKPTGLCSISK